MTKFFLPVTFIFLVPGFSSLAQPGDKRIQYPPGLKNAYFGFNLGYIDYPFTAENMEPGFTVESIKVPHIAPRFVLFGYKFNKHLAAQITYMRPVDWVIYKNINGNQEGYSVWMNVGGLTIAGSLPLTKKVSLFAESGLGVVTRKGFAVDNSTVIKDAAYATGLFGGAVQYHLNDKWDLQLSTVFSPANKKEKQPQTLYYAAGFNYNLKEVPAKRVEAIRKSGYYFPRHLLQATYTTNAFGYFVNDFFSETLPFFWGGAAHLQTGFSASYQRNIFRSRKVFSLDLGAGAGYWKSKKNADKFLTVSLYPVLRFTALRTKNIDGYIEYTVAGPTFISKTLIDHENTGRKFTFYDAMGVGVYTGKNKTFNAGIRIAHFSNGNIFPQNNGVKVPLSFSLGYAFSN